MVDAEPRILSDDRNTETSTLNCLSIDVEEYFHCEVHAQCVSRHEWDRYQLRAQPRIERIAELLAETRNRATFFILGWMVPHIAPLLRQLADAGHEIACHGDEHQHLSRMTPQTLREDLRQSRMRIEDAVGKSPAGYRAPTFSITRQRSWALDVIAESDLRYDSSIFPIRHDRYGIADAPIDPFWAQTPAGCRVLEFPPLTLSLGRMRIPMGGGGYLRLLPGVVMRHVIAACIRRNRPVMIYLHPWELDPDQPRMPVGRLSRWRHRVNLHTTEPKLRRLLRAFRFDTASNVLQRVQESGELPVYSLVTGASSACSHETSDGVSTTSKLA